MTAPRFEAVPAAAGPRIQGFAKSGFVVEGRTYRSLLLTPEAVLGWDAPALAALAPGDVDAIFALAPAPEFLLLGTGAAMAFPPSGFTAALEARGIGVEAMDSRAAARTWGLLRDEGRWIAAALMPI